MSGVAVARHCAVYTRTSSDEGLGQAFNSLDAQRSACEAFILSQAGEGWQIYPPVYSDGGFSGVTMARPGLQRLLADVAAGRIDVVVVYKVDRLTRSLVDFARIIDRFDQAKTSFVSVTQAFNTTTSMGKLTLNVLLSFAQFERDITAERIRDKIAASKARGLWMGGKPPLGYRPSITQSRTLDIVPHEADLVRRIFLLARRERSITAVQRVLNREGVRSKLWVTSDGRALGGCAWSRGALQHVLQNRIYLGEIAYRGQIFDGRHEAILDHDEFEDVQEILSQRRNLRRSRTKRADLLLLTGMIFDMDGQPMEPAFTQRRRKARTYAYYVARPLPGCSDESGEGDAIRRLPCEFADRQIREWAARLLGRPSEDLSRLAIRKLIRRVDVHPQSVILTITRAALPGGMSTAETLRIIRDRCGLAVQASADPAHASLLRVAIQQRLVKRGGRAWLHGPDGKRMVPGARPDAKLVARLRKAHALLRESGMHPSGPFRRQVNLPPRPHDRALINLAFLAPDLQRAVVCGELTLPAGVERQLPISWAKQREWVLSFAKAEKSGN